GGLPDTRPGNFDDTWLGGHQRPLEHAPGLQPVIEMGARQYHPVLARFLQVDPIEGGTTNDYAYVTDPTNQTDLSGRACAAWVRTGSRLLGYGDYGRGVYRVYKGDYRAAASNFGTAVAGTGVVAWLKMSGRTALSAAGRVLAPVGLGATAVDAACSTSTYTQTHQLCGKTIISQNYWRRNDSARKQAEASFYLKVLSNQRQAQIRAARARSLGWIVK
ncbi:MAG: RHS repeat-associated core domain-containing protein, partial [Microthrixaceae bacterium]